MQEAHLWDHPKALHYFSAYRKVTELNLAHRNVPERLIFNLLIMNPDLKELIV